MYLRLIRWAFARFYREFAWTYDAVAAAVSGGRWGMWGRAALPELAGQVLELGCGTGGIQRALAARADQPLACAIDASPQMLAITRRRLLHDHVPQRLVRAVAQALPFAPASFDSIVATFPTEYIIDYVTLAEVARVLRPHGRLVVVLAATLRERGWYARAVALLYRVTLQRSPRQLPSDAEERSLLGVRLAEHGFAVDERWQLVDGSHVHMVSAIRQA